MIVSSTPVYLVRITKHIRYLSPNKIIQEASLSHCGTRFYVTLGNGCGRSISVKSVEILACTIMYLSDNHYVLNSVDMRKSIRFGNRHQHPQQIK